jgi:hypothetical protein
MRNKTGYLLILFLFLNGCNHLNPYAPTVESSEPYKNYLKDFLNNSENKISCWEGLCPGVTSISNAQEKITQISDFKNMDELTESIKGSGELELWFNLEGGGGTIYSNKQGIVNIISLSIYGNQLLTIDELINKLGSPTHILQTDIRTSFSQILIIYMDKGFFVSIPINNSSKRIAISPNMKIDRIVFSPSGKEGYYENFTKTWPQYGNYLPWVGYTTYEFK